MPIWTYQSISHIEHTVDLLDVEGGITCRQARVAERHGYSVPVSVPYIDMSCTEVGGVEVSIAIVVADGKAGISRGSGVVEDTRCIVASCTIPRGEHTV